MIDDFKHGGVICGAQVHLSNNFTQEIGLKKSLALPCL